MESLLAGALASPALAGGLVLVTLAAAGAGAAATRWWPRWRRRWQQRRAARITAGLRAIFGPEEVGADSEAHLPLAQRPGWPMARADEHDEPGGSALACRPGRMGSGLSPAHRLPDEADTSPLAWLDTEPAAHPGLSGDLNAAHPPSQRRPLPVQSQRRSHSLGQRLDHATRAPG